MVRKPAQKPPVNKTGILSVVFLAVISCLIAASSLIFSSYIQSNGSQKSAKNRQVSLTESSNKSSRLTKVFSKATSYKTTTDLQVLSDSILSIIQGYYVDSSRVNNHDIFAALVEVLRQNPLIKIELAQKNSLDFVDQNRVLPDFKDEDLELILKIEGNTYKWNPSQYLNNIGLSEFYVEISKILEKHNIMFPLGDGESPVDEQGKAQDPPSLITLYAKTLSSLDAHSALLSPQSYRELRQGTEGSFGGLGVLVGIRNQILTVIKPLPKSPAQRFGIKPSDRIIGINGKYTFGFTLEQMVEYMRGDPGTDVHLSLLRKDASTPIQVQMKREIIQVDSIAVEEILTKSGMFLKINIENFASRTSREVINAIKQFKHQHHGRLDGLILDLRGNPGGLLDQAVQVADLFLPSGVIVSTRGRREEVEKADSGIDEMGFPIITLIDGDSASASEIVAGALQDHGRSLVIGQASFGKGSVQTIFELPQERALKITIARYYTPSGRSIQNVGIIPDIWLQPLFQKQINENLLGSYRYKNERYLRNHLEGAKESGNTSLRVPAIKSYYLTPLGNDAESDFETSSNKPFDREREIALLILRKLHNTYKGSPSELALRASHWLGLAGPEVTSRCNELDQETNSWLQKNLGISWSKPKGTENSELLSLKILENQAQAIIGEDYKIQFSITNNGTIPIDRVSIFLRSEHPFFETQEMLIGSIGPRQTINGNLRYSVPINWDPGKLALRVGVAIDSWPVSTAVADHLLTIHPKNLATLKALTDLVDENGGILTDILETKERAKIRVTLENTSDVTANEVVVRVVNLSGKQTTVNSQPQTYNKILPGQTTFVDFDVEASQILYGTKLDFGLQVESKSIKTGIKKHFKIKSIPNSAISIKNPQNLGH